MNLDEDFKKLDLSGVENALNSFPDQIKTTFKQGLDSKIDSLDFDSIVVSGMGGSSNAGKIVQGLLEDNYSKQFIVYNDYGLPYWVNKKTLLIVNSYSGNTEESLSAISQGLKIGCPIIGIATGGKISEMINNNEIYGAIINPGETNPTGFPKTGLGVSLGGLLGVLVKIGVLNYNENDINQALDEIINLRKTWDVKVIAKWLHGFIPVLFGGRPFLGALNAGRNAMCEISRNFTEFYDFPEVNHVLIEATQKPLAAKNKKYIFFESNFNNERVKLRFEITKNLLKEQGLTYKSYELKSSNYLSQSLEIAHYCSWLGFYISILDDTDPGPEPWIISLKESLSQPVH